MAVERPVLPRFMLLYCALFSAFGCASPFLPAFLAGRGLGPEELGLVLGGATALRLVCGQLHRSLRHWRPRVLPLSARDLLEPPQVLDVPVEIRNAVHGI